MKKGRLAPGPFVLPMPTVLVGAMADAWDVGKNFKS